MPASIAAETLVKPKRSRRAVTTGMVLRADNRAAAARCDGDEAWLGGSEMAAMVRAFDWAQTPLGPIRTWRQSLKSAAAMCLHSPFQMGIYWGPELNCIYNDAERGVLGNLHPGALGLPASELLRDSWDVVGPQLRRVIERGEGTWAEDQPLSFDRRGKLEVSYFTYSYSAIPDDDGTVGGVLLVTQDTTARVLAERRLDVLHEVVARSLDAPTAARASALCCQALTGGEDVPCALIYLTDEAGTRATCAAAGAGGARFAAPPPTVELDASSDAVAALFRSATSVRSAGKLGSARLFEPRPGRRRGVREVFVAPIGRSPTDAVEGYLVQGIRDDLAFDQAYAEFLEMVALGVGRSVAAARARETQRQRVSDIAAIDQAKTALFSNASHELRTPLALILGHLDELLAGERLSEFSRDKVEGARRSALRMLKLVNGLLDFSRIDAGEGIGVFQETDIAQLTGEIAAMFRSTAERAGLQLIVDCPPLAEPASVDPDAWERIVSNLISNALKFTPKGEIRVSTRTENDDLHMTVEDTGIGIAPQDLDQVFSRFYRSPDPRARMHDGSGIGLALVRQLAQTHGGSVEARSRPGQGTRMIVRIPLSRDHRPADAGDRTTLNLDPCRPASLFVAEAEGWFGGRRSTVELEHPVTQQGPETDQVSVGGKDGRPRVLVAEDNADMREYLRRVLSPHFSVTVAHDGARAWELARRKCPSIVVSDVMMPGWDGFTLIRELRRDERTRDVPVILLSARADPEATLQALELGADDYIIKPFGAPELLARVRTTLQNSRARIDAAVARGRVAERARNEGELRALLGDLRAAQRRGAAAADAERRRIEQNLHDGAQQRLTAIRLELGLTRELLVRDPAAAGQRLDELHHELDEAVDELRELAHGVYPPLLASDGLYAALRSAAGHAGIPVTVQGADISRAPRSIESAAYFCCLEALQNATKHAGAGATVSIDVSTASGILEFRISDDGAGFDSRAVRPGYGLTNLRDRVGVLGGDVDVTSSPGCGTTVVGRIPLP